MESDTEENNVFAENTDAPGKITSFYICGIVNATLTAINILLILLIIKCLNKSSSTIPVHLQLQDSDYPSKIMY